ncbi:MAG TPA: hypothetical protein VGN79_05745, partial [Devosia sp.]|nr:hypothetical protein [Devosia sp.]
GKRDATVADTLGRTAGEDDDSDQHTEEWRAGYNAATSKYKPARRRFSASSLLFAVPAAVAVSLVQRRKKQQR